MYSISCSCNKLETMKNIIAFGNPLLDSIVFTTNMRILEKYGLKEDGQKEVESEEMEKLIKDIDSEYTNNKICTAGGCAQNSLRVLQWLSNKKHNCIIFGSVGEDKDAFSLKALLESDGVKTHYFVQKQLTTGKVVSLVSSDRLYRSLVVHLGAAEQLSDEVVIYNKNVEDILQKSDFVYIEGFFLTKREDISKYILNFCNSFNRIVAFNISGEYICKLIPTTLKYFVENSDIIFGNFVEFQALTKLMEFKSIEELATVLIKNGKNKLKKYGNIVVVTNGSESVKCYYNIDQKCEFIIEPIHKNDFKDTTGAGDAFVGGFLAGLCEEKPIIECLKIGCYAAKEIIKQIGCTLPL